MRRPRDDSERTTAIILICAPSTGAPKQVRGRMRDAAGDPQQHSDRRGLHPHSHQPTRGPHRASGRGHWLRVTPDQRGHSIRKQRHTHALRRTFSRADLHRCTSHREFSAAETTSGIYYNHEALRPETNYKKKETLQSPQTHGG